MTSDPSPCVALGVKDSANQWQLAVMPCIVGVPPAQITSNEMDGVFLAVFSMRWFEKGRWWG